MVRRVYVLLSLRWITVVAAILILLHDKSIITSTTTVNCFSPGLVLSNSPLSKGVLARLNRSSSKSNQSHHQSQQHQQSSSSSLLTETKLSCFACSRYVSYSLSDGAVVAQEPITLEKLREDYHLSPYQKEKGEAAKQKLHICVWKNDGLNGQDQKENDEVDDEHRNEESQPSSSGVSSALIATIGIYKNFISPLLPPACRFVPTCSQYGVQALKEFGLSKGVILTSWRLLRCSPFGGKGYDPPKWPPPPYTYSSY